MTIFSTAFILTISVLYILSPVNAVLLSAGFAAILFLIWSYTPIGRFSCLPYRNKEYEKKQETKYL